MIVTPDRFACGQYKEELDNYFPESASRVIISTSSNDDFEFKQKWGIDSDEQERIIDEYNDVCLSAIKKGYLKILKYAHENGCPWNEDTCSRAAVRSNLDCLKYAIENGCSHTQEQLDLLSKN